VRPAPPAPAHGREIRLLEVVTRMDVGGVPSHVLLLLEGLCRRGYRITLACAHCTPAHGAALEALGVRLLHLDLRRLLSPVADLRAFAALYRLIREEEFDIVHTHMSKAALLGGLAGWLGGAPVVVNTAHNLGSIALPKAWLRGLFWLYDKLLLSITADSVITVTDRLRAEVVARRIVGSSRVRAIPNGLRPRPTLDDTEAGEARNALLAEIGAGPGTLVVGSVARLVWFKGLDALIAALPAVAEACPECRLVLVGDGPMRAQLEQQAQALGVGERVAFLGERHDVERMLPAFDVFTLPSVSEGMPMTILEAMQASRPVVATSVGGVPELVADGESGLLVAPRDPAALADALIRLLGDATLRRAMGASGRDRVQAHFTAAGMAAATDQLFRGLLAGAGRREVLSGMADEKL
jgi:glycosyltransferase involved in cell wall biosynthesis